MQYALWSYFGPTFEKLISLYANQVSLRNYGVFPIGLLMIVGIILFSTQALGQESYNIPSWIKNNAKWWAEGQIGDSDFSKGLQYLIEQKIMIIPQTNVSSNPSNGIPAWIKNNAKWWADGQISDGDFVKGIQFLVANGIIQVNIKTNNQCPPGQQFDPASNSCVLYIKPSFPQNLQVTAGNGQVSLIWQAPSSNGGTSITSYKIYRSTLGGQTVPITVGNVTSFTDLDLTNGVTYFYKVTALSSAGESTPSSETSVTPSTAPLAPQNLQATASNGHVSLIWQVPSNNGGSAITGYKIYRSTTAGIEKLLTTLGNVLSYDDSGLANGAKYFYKVTALNSFGESPQSNESSATSSAPATVSSVPQNLQATAGNGQVSLIWQAPSSNGGSAITSYKIYRSTTADTETLLTTVGNVTSYADTGLINGITYFYKVTALSSAGESIQSSESSAAPSAPLVTISLHFAIFSPPAVQSSQLGSQDITVSFNPNVLSKYPSLQKIILFFEVTACNPPNGHDLNGTLSTARSLSTINYIGYDPEASNADLSTCLTEVQNMGSYTSQAADTVHSAGYLFETDPTWGELKSYYQSIDWTKVDMLIIQGQQYTNDPSFNSVITSEVNLIHSKNPNTKIYLQVNPDLDTTAHIATAVSSVKNLLYGVSIVCQSPGCTTSVLDNLISQLKAL